jgi:hypothetical protein
MGEEEERTDKTVMNGDVMTIKINGHFPLLSFSWGFVPHEVTLC